MKHKTKYLTGAALACALLFAVFSANLFTGCTTTSSTSTGGTNTTGISTNTATKYAGLVKIAVSGAVILGYSQDTNCLQYIDFIRVALVQFFESSDLSSTALKDKIDALQINELKSDTAQLIIATVIETYKTFGSELVKQGYQANTGLRILVKALIEGLDAGVSAVKT
jgi:hypothetical protein